MNEARKSGLFFARGLHCLLTNYTAGVVFNSIAPRWRGESEMSDVLGGAALPRPGSVLRAVSGSRPISVAVVDRREDAVTLECGDDWSFQGGGRFELTAEQFRASIWSRASQ